MPLVLQRRDFAAAGDAGVGSARAAAIMRRSLCPAPGARPEGRLHAPCSHYRVKAISRVHSPTVGGLASAAGRRSWPGRGVMRPTATGTQRGPSFVASGPGEVHARPGLPGLRARAMLRGRRGEVSEPVAIARFLVLSVFALAIAVAPAAQCTTPRHASLADLTVAEPPAYPHDGGWSVGIVPAPDDGDVVGAGAEAISAAAEAAGDIPDDVAPKPSHRHQPQQKRAASCPATCSPLACQAAVPAPPASGAISGLRPAERLRALQEDAVADPHLLRIERPPRRTA